MSVFNVDEVVYDVEVGAPEPVVVELSTADSVLEIEVNNAQGSPGSNAYQLAVSQGFSGTLEEWLDTLVADADAAIEAWASIPDDTLGVIDPDTAYVALQTILSDLLPPELVDAVATGTLSYISSMIAGQPTDVKAAVITLADLMGLVVAYLGSLGLQFSDLYSSLGAIDVELQTYGNVVTHDVDEFATSGQGELADTAVQPGDTGVFASVAQGELADSAVQPEDHLWSQNANVRDVSNGNYTILPTDGVLVEVGGFDSNLTLPLINDVVDGFTVSLFGNSFTLTAPDGYGIYDYDLYTTIAPINTPVAIPGTCRIVRYGGSWLVTGVVSRYVKTDDIGTAAAADTGDFATAAQGSTADSAVQPGDLPSFGDIVTADSADFIVASEKGATNGVAELVDGVVPSFQLPGYVDDVLDYANLAAFPGTGEAGKIYVAIDTNLAYRWTGSAYGVISPSLALGETSATAYRGDRGKTAYDHSQATGNPHGTTVADIGAVPTSRTLAGLDLSADRTAAALRTALGGWQEISRKTIASNSASESFTITGYKMIRCTIAARSTRNASVSDTLRMRFNGDTGANYSTQASALTVYANPANVPNSVTTTDRIGHVIIQWAYSAGSKLSGTSVQTAPTSTTGLSDGGQAWAWMWTGASSAAPTTVSFYCGNGDIAAGSEFLVEGYV
jgi:hypothetical protein